MNKQILNKRKIYLIILLIAGVFLLFISNIFSSTPENPSNNTPNEFELCEKRCEERIVSLLLSLDGIQGVSAMVTLDQMPTNKERPKIRGVAVVCEGTETSDLRFRVVMLISSALGVTSDKIYVTFT